MVRMLVNMCHNLVSSSSYLHSRDRITPHFLLQEEKEDDEDEEGRKRERSEFRNILRRGSEQGRSAGGGRRGGQVFRSMKKEETE